MIKTYYFYKIFTYLLCMYTFTKTPVTHPWMLRLSAPGFLIWKMLSDLQIVFFIRERVRNVLMASATDVMCP